jgi:hypothetical protein
MPPSLISNTPTSWVGSEAVLRAAQQAIALEAIALQVEDRVHHVLQHLGAGDGALLGDVADHEDRDASALGQVHQAQRALTQLADVAGRRLQIA